MAVKIPHSEDEIRKAFPYTQPRGHAVGTVESGASVVSSPAAVSISPHGTVPKRTQTAPAPVHPSMQREGNRGHAVSKAHAPAQPLTNVQGNDASKKVPVPPVHPSARGRHMTSDPTYQPASHAEDVAIGDRCLDEAIDHTPGSHHSHTSNMRK